MSRHVANLNYCGIGDAVTMFWIAEGWKAAGHTLAFNGQKPVCEVFGQEHTDEPGMVQVATSEGSLYNTELTIRGRARPPRPILWQEWMPIQALIRRPKLALTEAQMEAGRQAVSGHALGCPMVLLFPFASFKTRTWPLGKWVRLAWALKERGIASVALHSTGEKLTHFPLYMHGLGLPDLCGMIAAADVVLGNDSGMVHVAGTVGTPSIALMGPTTPTTVFGHLPDVRAVRTTVERVGCVGCHFDHERGFSGVCDLSCEALQDITVGQVVSEVEQLVEARHAART